MRSYSIFLLIFSIVFMSGQNITSSRWSDLFSYNNVLQIREKRDGTLIAATQNGLFFYNPSSGEITKLSKANGLHEVKISAFDYNSESGIGLVGYASGTMDVITDDAIQYIVDIPLASNFTTSKKINHISINGTQAVISAGYGVSLFNLDRKEFGDTAFFLSGGTYTAVNEAVIFGDKVYAATSGGIWSHKMDVTFPSFSGWTKELAGNITQMSTDGSLMVAGTTSSVYKNTGSGFSQISGSFSGIKDITVIGGQILITESKTANLLTDNGSVKKYPSEETLNTVWYTGNRIFYGSQSSGILNETGQFFKPDGPYDNRSYKMELDSKGRIWVSTGLRDARFNLDSTDPRNLGFYFYDGKEWVYPSYFKNTTSVAFNILDAVPNPSNYKEVFLANYRYQNSAGFYRMEYDEAKKDFNMPKYYPTWDTSAESRPVGLVFDDQNNLFGVASFAPDLFYYNRATDVFVKKNHQIDDGGGAAQKPVYYEGLLWLPLPRRNIFAAIDLNATPSNLNDDRVYTLGKDNGLPDLSDGVVSVDIDRSGDAWIGTSKGLRVLYNAVSEIKGEKPHAEAIIIEENGVGEELFRDTPVLQIKVDSGNQKWISIDGGGIFYLNSTGETTIHKFTAENSPLPNNSVTDIKIDEKTGKVYFVTLDGIVTYQGDVSNVTENFGNVVVYPNPVVYANYKGNVRIKGLAEKTNIRITDAAGNLVHQAVARGGYYEWDLKNQRNARVASGIYFVLMTNDDGTDTKTAKIAVVN